MLYRCVPPSAAPRTNSLTSRIINITSTTPRNGVTYERERMFTVKVLNFQTSKLFGVITLKFEQRRLSIEKFVQKVQTE